MIKMRTVLLLVVSFFCVDALAIVRSSDARPALPVGMEIWSVRKGVNVLTNRFNAISPNQGCHLADFLKDADRGDILTFCCHDGGEGFVTVADVGKDGELHWFDKQNGTTVDGALLSAYHHVFTWERKTDRESKISFAGRISERVYPDVAADFKERFERENSQFTMLMLPFPSFAGKTFRIVLVDGRTKDVFFDKGTQLLYEMGKLEPLLISTSDIREYWELPAQRKGEVCVQSGTRVQFATKDDLEKLRKHIDQVTSGQTQEIKEEIRERTKPEPVTWWGCAKEYALGPFARLGSWQLAGFGFLLALCVLFLVKKIGGHMILLFKRICGYEDSCKRKKRK